MEKTKKITWIGNSILGVVLIGLFLLNLIPNFYLDLSFQIVVYIGLAILTFIGMKLQLRKTGEEEKEKVRRRNITRIFVIYCFFLISILLFSGSVRMYTRGDDGLGLFSEEHFAYYSNFIPFHTIGSYFQRIAEQSINLSIPIMNLLGNLVLFLPMGFFLPYLWKEKFGKFPWFVLSIIGIVVLVEFIQFVTLKGQADIDDVILNTLGAMIGFGFFRIPMIQKAMKCILR